MNRSLFGIGLCFLLFLAACGSPTAETPVADVEEAEAVVESEAESPADSAQAEPDAEEAVAVESESTDASEEMIEEEEDEIEEEMIEEEVDAEEVASASDGENESVFSAPNFPAVLFEDALAEREFDKVKGGDDPLITIIEYGDFQ
ncbi:MAG: hypothetical protein AAF633_08560 [Chloroflexota bacterium]